MNARLGNAPASARSFLLTNWVTVRGSSSVLSVTQDADGWLELPNFADATFYVDVSEVSPPTSGLVLLYLDTAPTLDEALFQPVAGPIVCTAGSAPLLAKTASAGLVPLSRYLRWRVVATTAASWDLTFRVRVVANRSMYFAPTQLPGCLLWLRADLGVTFSGTTVSAWADQSGLGHSASQGTGANQPTFTQLAIGGFPAIQGDGTARYMTTGAFIIGSATTLCAVVEPLGTEAGYTRILDQQYNATYYLGTNSNSSKYKLIVDNGSPPYGVAETGSITTNVPVIVTGTYASPTGTIYVNGSTPGVSDSFTAPSPSVNQSLYIMQCYNNAFNEYWNGYLSEVIIYNRAIAANEFTRLHRYLGTRYGISVP